MWTITCIKRNGKLCKDIKNWRPLILWNNSFKFLSAIIADRIKVVLESIISPDQTGYISNCFIGENTTLLLDTIMVDFTKAFNTMEWNYIDHVLDLCDFGDKISSWIKLSRFKSMSKIEHYGNFSDFIQLSAGRSHLTVHRCALWWDIITCYQRR